MSIQSLNNSGQASAINATTASNAALTDQQAMDAFVQALTQFMSFQPSSSLPSLPGIFHTADAQQSAAPTPTQHQSNDQPQQQNDSGPKIVQSGQNGPAQTQGSQSSSCSQTKSTAKGPVQAQSDSTDQKQTDQTTSTIDPTADQTVMAVAAQQVVQVTQTVQQTQTVATDTNSLGTQATGPIEQATVNPDQTGQTGPLTQTGPQTGPQTVDTKGQKTEAKASDSSNAQNDTWSLIQGGTQQVASGQAAQTNAKGQRQSTKDQQADALAASLNDTGANLAINVAVNTNVKSTAAETQTTDQPVVQAVPVIPADPLASNSNGQGFGKDDGEQQDIGQAVSQIVDVKTSAADTLAQNAENFTAVLAAQLEGTQAESAPPPTQQNISGVTGVGGAQATQKTQSAQAPQAPTPPRQPMPAQVLDQISVQINKQAKDGVDSIKVQLRPEELGRIEIKLEVSKDGSVQATVTAENKETLAMLQKDSAGLAKALSDAGLSTDSGSMNFNLRGEGQQQFAGNSNSQNGNNGSSGGSNSRAPWLSATGNDDVDVIAQSAISSDAAVDIRV